MAIGEAAGSAVSFIPRTDTLGVVLPSNSPGVHALWVPTIALPTSARAEARKRGALDALPHRSRPS